MADKRWKKALPEGCEEVVSRASQCGRTFRSGIEWSTYGRRELCEGFPTCGPCAGKPGYSACPHCAGSGVRSDLRRLTAEEVSRG